MWLQVSNVAAGPRRSLARQRLDWRTVISFEVLAGFLLLGALTAIFLHATGSYVPQARVGHAWGREFIVQRIELSERLAVTGEGFVVPDAPRQVVEGAGRRLTAVDDLEAAMLFKPRLSGAAVADGGSSRHAGSAPRPALLSFFGSDASRERAEAKAQVRIVEQSLLIGINVDAGRKPFALAVSPGVIGDGTPGSIMWLCGHRAAPIGWYRLPGPAGTDLPGNIVPAVCRNERES